MTDREAIEYLEFKRFTGSEIPATCEDIALAISALKEREERSKGCEYCDPTKYNSPFGHHITKELDYQLRIEDAYLIAERYDEPDSEVKIAFCSMCGRPLKVEDNETN